MCFYLSHPECLNRLFVVLSRVSYKGPIDSCYSLSTAPIHSLACYGRTGLWFSQARQGQGAITRAVPTYSAQRRTAMNIATAAMAFQACRHRHTRISFARNGSGRLRGLISFLSYNTQEGRQADCNSTIRASAPVALYLLSHVRDELARTIYNNRRSLKNER